MAGDDYTTGPTFDDVVITVDDDALYDNMEKWFKDSEIPWVSYDQQGQVIGKGAQENGRWEQASARPTSSGGATASAAESGTRRRLTVLARFLDRPCIDSAAR